MTQSQNSFFPSPTLYATVVKLIAADSGSIPATQGRQANAAFLDIIRAADPALSAKWHDSQAPGGRKPFTVSPLRGLDRPRRGNIAVRRGQQAQIRFTLLNSELFAAFTRRFLIPLDGAMSVKLPGIRLGGVNFIVSEMLTTPGSDEWAGYTTFNNLVEPWQSPPFEGDPQQIAVKFASPVVFSFGNRDGLRGKWMEPFPTPRLFFGNLAGRWNAFMPAPLDVTAIEEYAQQTVVVGRYRMESKMFRYWKNPQIGAVGNVTYLLKDKKNVEMIGVLNTLADFAFYSGVGYKTTMGMGQVKKLKIKN